MLAESTEAISSWAAVRRSQGWVWTNPTLTGTVQQCRGPRTAELARSDLNCSNGFSGIACHIFVEAETQQVKSSSYS